MKICHFLGVRSRKKVPGTNFHVNRLITYLGTPSNRCFVSFRSNKPGRSLNFVTIISLLHWFAGRYYFFSIGHLAKSSIHTLYKRNKRVNKNVMIIISIQFQCTMWLNNEGLKNTIVI